ncbi:hypothetical protein [Adhaeribacter soli]|uniref:Uncharacterized protein n=1 Tax=Adhaeribacter soli TaxID=2607655 RepID=A0A5N1J2J3_9BACT|nr:hypothetical protein [Adhaeribacter soli]KAA9340983.1 hypothetical protein F0P94_06035 [Adhaeribacter soli]
MKKLFGFLLVASLFTGSATLAQSQAAPEDITSTFAEKDNSDKDNSDKDLRTDKKKQKQVAADINASGNVYNSQGSKAAKPVSPFASNSSNTTNGGFTVTKYKESKVAKKLRRGQASSRMSVPDPKGKPLKHKKKKKFLFFN